MIIKLSQATPEQIDQAFVAYVESFYEPYAKKLISRDKGKLHTIFKACFDHEQVYIYLLDGRAVGFLGWATKGNHAIKPNKKVLRQHVGFLWGTVVAIGFNLSQPLARHDDEAIIEYCAVCPLARGQGVGGKLIAHLCEASGHSAYILETTEENSSAVRLYSKLGFVKLPKKLNLIIRATARMFKLGTPILMKLDADSLCPIKNIQ